jgi:ribosomal-protein-alanine N-acetyltransferase
MESVDGKDALQVSLEEASGSDIASLIEIEKAIPKTNTYSPMVTKRGWQRELSENTVLILKMGGIAVGSIAYAEKSPKHVYISGMIVRPEYQGRGLATKAIQEVLAKHHDAKRIDLVTHPDNPALNLYESLGFKIEGRKENYFGDGEPRLVLALVRG